MLTIHHAPEDVKARNATVAFADFIRTDLTYLYEDQLRTALLSTLDANGFIRVVPGDKVENAMVQRSLVPLKGNDAQLGVRLGANYLINTEIIEYRVDQAANVTVPLLIGFPETDFKLVCRTSLIDMVTGEKHSLGDISATVKKPRGVKFFPIGPSSDMVFLSEPERRNAEKELINQWVGQFTDAMIEKSSLFAWEPKQADIGAVESQSAPITPLP
jgi:hypothetical protein